jgi:hypothetical protein
VVDINYRAVASWRQGASRTGTGARRRVASAFKKEPEGDYDDGLADTLPLDGAEVRAYNAALTQFQLIAQSRDALTRDLAQIRATNRQFNRRFGGGE